MPTSTRTIAHRVTGATLDRGDHATLGDANLCNTNLLGGRTRSSRVAMPSEGPNTS